MVTLNNCSKNQEDSKQIKSVRAERRIAEAKLEWKFMADTNLPCMGQNCNKVPQTALSMLCKARNSKDLDHFAIFLSTVLCVKR